MPDFYIAYCEELSDWSSHRWPTPGEMTVVRAEFALWTWYRLAFSQETVDREHRNRFYNDPWVQRRRALGVKRSLGSKDRLVLASALVEADPAVAAFTALREFEVTLRKYVGTRAGSQPTTRERIYTLGSHELPSGVDYADLERLAKARNAATHENLKVSSAEASRVIEEVTPIVRYFRSR